MLIISSKDGLHEQMEVQVGSGIAVGVAFLLGGKGQ